jgi:hypothetical protein
MAHVLLNLSNVGSPSTFKTRQWAELAYWFQPLSEAAGTRDLAVLPLDRNAAQEETGGDGGWLSDYTSHTYLTGIPFWRVWSTYHRIERAFE